eukprot:10215460-Alexandrium_andersonii.AAC.1
MAPPARGRAWRASWARGRRLGGDCPLRGRPLGCGRWGGVPSAARGASACRGLHPGGAPRGPCTTGLGGRHVGPC